MAECTPDWTQELSPASWRGIRFHIETNNIKGGWRIHSHQYPNRDRPFQEIMGEKMLEYPVTAYLASDDVIEAQKSMVSALRQRGPGTLVLPEEGSIQAVVLDWERSAKKDQQGYIAFTIHFLEAGADLGLLSGFSLDRLVGIGVAEAVDFIAGDFLQAFKTFGEPSWVLDAAVDHARTFLGVVDELRLGIAIEADKIATDVTSVDTIRGEAEELAENVTSLFDDARDLLYTGREVVAAPGGMLGAGGRVGPDDFVYRLADVVAGLRLSCSSPEVALDVLDQLVDYNVTSGNVGSGLAAQAEASNEVALNNTLRRLAIMEMSVAAAESTFTDRRTVIAYRARLSEAYDRELHNASGKVFAKLSELRGKTAASLSAKVVDLRTTVEIEAVASAPALVWAHRLYADATKADGMAKRNGVRHPAFMPTKFEAEAPG